ncbi:MAG: 2-hydroxychromene-2-carboxylate isomerase [Myxococcota bacterium]
MRIHFTFDIVCPFAWVASQRVRALAEEAGAELVLQPVLLGGLLKAIGSPTVPMDAMSDAKWRIVRTDALRQGAWHGVPVAWPSHHPQRTVDAMRLIVAAPPERQFDLATDLFRAYWVDGRDVASPVVLAQVADAHGLDPAIGRTPEAKAALFTSTRSATEAGVFGVPTLRIGDGPDTPLFWGVDRLDAARAALGLPDEPPRDGGVRGRRLVLFHDFASPFSYLGHVASERVAAAAGAELEVVPILLGALFHQLGGPLVPIATFSDRKQQYVHADLARLAQAAGVRLRWPTAFPLRTVVALRVAVQEPATTGALYEAAWCDDLDVSRPEVVTGVLQRAGFEGERLVAGAADPTVKAQLRRNTERALAAGACGAPTFVVDDTHLFWGQDRLAQVHATLTGWQPPTAPRLDPEGALGDSR